MIYADCIKKMNRIYDTAFGTALSGYESELNFCAKQFPLEDRAIIYTFLEMAKKRTKFIDKDYTICRETTDSLL